MKLVILLNGYPGSGKDTIAKYLEDKHDFKHIKFAEEVVKSFCAAYKIEVPSRIFYDLNKDLSGMFNIPFKTLREGLIYWSEEVIKPTFGQDVWGRLTLKKISNKAGSRFVISDLGFESEYATLLEGLDKSYKIIICRVNREGCSRRGDSRTLIPEDFVIDNPGNSKLFPEIERILDYILRL